MSKASPDNEKHQKTKPKPEAPRSLHEPEPDAAGIDLAATEIWVAVGQNRCEEPVRRFGGFTQDLMAILQWLRECGIRTVAMEATGVYWIPLYQILSDAGIKVCLVNARHVKNVPGRKVMCAIVSGCSICTASGLLRASYRPDQAVCRARSIYRFRQNLLTPGAQHLQHMQAALDQMNIKLHHVIDDLSGVTGMAIIEAILNGEREPLRLAKFKPALAQRPSKPRRKTSKNEPDGPWRQELHRFFGVDLTLIPGISVLTGITLMTELGNDLSAFKTHSTLVPGCVCVRITKPVLGKCCTTVRAEAKIEFDRPCGWQPVLCIMKKAIWATSTDACAPN